MKALFTDYTNNKFTLAPSSAARDAGVSGLANGVFKAAPSDDLSGKSRPQGNGFDAGAFEYAVLPADANGDQIVNIADFKILLDNYGTPNDFNHGDFSRNGVVDFTDFQIFELNFGETLLPGGAIPGALPVPEPSAMLLLISLSAMQLRRRKRTH
jgi:hypothetical protein